MRATSPVVEAGIELTRVTDEVRYVFVRLLLRKVCSPLSQHVCVGDETRQALES